MIQDSPLGQATVYVQTYTPGLLYPVPRSLAREKRGIPSPAPFSGIDIWNGFELSWLNPKGKPEIALAEFSFPCISPNIVESKSFKLYLNSFNQSRFGSFEDVKKTLEKDLKSATGGPVTVKLYRHDDYDPRPLSRFSGICLDNLDIETEIYDVTPQLLKTERESVQEKIYTDLFKSNCLATGQPDWGSVLIHYSGDRINHESLLKYFISFRNHSGFAEHCVEQIYCDILKQCSPKQLSVNLRFTRRGGLDINPFRSNFEEAPLNLRHIRQ